MPFDSTRQTRGQGDAVGFRHTVCRALRLLRQRLAAWRKARRRGEPPAEVVIGTLRKPKLAIAIRATVVRTDRTPPPLPVFLERIVAQPLNPSCPRCSLPLEPWQADAGAAGTVMGYECPPCGTRLRWPPADVVKQMHREVRRHYAQYWAQYRAAIERHAREAPRRRGTLNRQGGPHAAGQRRPGEAQGG
jgi:hypothetical protein